MPTICQYRHSFGFGYYDSMTEDFLMPLVHNGTAYEFPGWMFLQGYTHRIKVLVQGCEVFFEPDE